jgi:hypothetical protein
MGEAALAANQESPQLAFKLLHRACERGLCNVSILRRAREVQRLAQGKKISDLIQFHPRTTGAAAKCQTAIRLQNSTAGGPS